MELRQFLSGLRNVVHLDPENSCALAEVLALPQRSGVGTQSLQVGRLCTWNKRARIAVFGCGCWMHVSIACGKVQKPDQMNNLDRGKSFILPSNHLKLKEAPHLSVTTKAEPEWWCGVQEGNLEINFCRQTKSSKSHAFSYQYLQDFTLMS